MQWPLVGREAELETIRRTLTDAKSGGLVITGAAGVGKTRLAAEASALAEARDDPVLWIHATRAARSLPLGAFAALMAPTTAAPGVELLALARRSLRERAAGRRLILCVDDGHLLDDASAALVHQLAAARDAFVVVTLRRDAGMSDALAALWKDDVCERIELRELSREEVEGLLDEVLAGPVERRSANALWELSRGNVQFLRELVRYGRDHGMLADAGGIWRWSGTPIAVGTRLADLVGLRLADLDDGRRRVLELVAAGAPLEIDVLDDDERLALEVLEALELVELRREGRRRLLDVVHPLHGEVVRAGMTSMRWQALLQRLADAAQSRGGRRRTDLPRMAAFRLEAGDRRDPALFERASLLSLAARDPAAAERFARAAIEAGGGFAAELALGRALAGEGGRRRRRRFWSLSNTGRAAMRSGSRLRSRLRATGSGGSAEPSRPRPGCVRRRRWSASVTCATSGPRSASGLPRRADARARRSRRLRFAGASRDTPRSRPSPRPHLGVRLLVVRTPSGRPPHRHHTA